MFAVVCAAKHIVREQLPKGAACSTPPLTLSGLAYNLYPGGEYLSVNLPSSVYHELKCIADRAGEKYGNSKAAYARA